MQTYLDNKGIRVAVRAGLGGDTYMAMRLTDDFSAGHRVKSPKLPPRPTEAEAQADLDAYADAKGWGRELPLRIDSLDEVGLAGGKGDRTAMLGLVVDQAFGHPFPCTLLRVVDDDDTSIGAVLVIRGERNAVRCFNAIQDLRLDHGEGRR